MYSPENKDLSSFHQKMTEEKKKEKKNEVVVLESEYLSK